MPPTRVVIIRHCDKGKNASNPNCNTQGYRRADLLPHVWERLGVNTCSLRALFAARNEGGNRCPESERTNETLAPTAALWHFDICSPFCTGRERDLAIKIWNLPCPSGDVVVSMEHYSIIELLRFLGAKNPRPAAWPASADDRYDFVFVLDLASGSWYVTTMGLDLPGDSNAVPAVWPSLSSSVQVGPTSCFVPRWA